MGAGRLSYAPDQQRAPIGALGQRGASMDADTFLSFFSEQRFIRDLRARTKEGALTEMTQVLSGDSEVRNPAVLLEMIHRRESLGSTGLGKGIAIPHGRSTAAGETRVVYARSRKGIDYGAIDGEPCHIFFMIIAPYADQRHEYLPLLGKIVEVVSESDVRDKLLAVESFAEFQGVVREVMGE